MKNMTMAFSKTCSICAEPYSDHGHNADPFPGRCCDKCQRDKVLPARLKRVQEGLSPRIRGNDEDRVNEILESYAKGGNTDIIERAAAAIITRTDEPQLIGSKLMNVLKRSRHPDWMQHSSFKAATDEAKSASLFTDAGAIEVETVADKNRLIHLYHLLMDKPKLAYAGESIYGHFLRCLNDRDFILPFGNETKLKYAQHIEEMLPQLETLCPFVVNHNWSAVLQSAGEGETGEFRLPDEEATVFEFAMEGFRVLAIATDLPDLADVGLHIWIRLDKRWICLGAEKIRSPVDLHAQDVDVFYADIRSQIRAACIVMEAEVAETDVIRADYKRNEKRQRQGLHKFFDYHVVNLAKRHRLVKPEAGPANDDRRASPRLHFVKGHYRHFDNWKTWIKWHYRGDADLGFIDKEYRL